MSKIGMAVRLVAVQVIMFLITAFMTWDFLWFYLIEGFEPAFQLFILVMWVGFTALFMAVFAMMEDEFF